MNKNFRKFSDVVIDTNKVVMVRKSLVLLDNGEWYDVGDEAADAMRKAFTPHCEREQHSALHDTQKE